MVQDQSKAVNSTISYPKREDTSSVSSDKSPPSMESLLAEATAFGDVDENASLEEKAQKALECPCIQNNKKGPCSPKFANAFKCFLMITAEEKAEAVPEKPMEDYKMIPPRWAVDSPSPNPRQKL
ncbi:mitochondrial intermembrane space import and assembly protein 40 [Tanacetum coccineum]